MDDHQRSPIDISAMKCGDLVIPTSALQRVGFVTIVFPCFSSGGLSLKVLLMSYGRL